MHEIKVWKTKDNKFFEDAEVAQKWENYLSLKEEIQVLMNLKIIRKIPVIVVMVLIFVLSSIQISLPSSGYGVVEKDYLLLILHVGEFGLLSMTMMLGFYPQIKSYILLIITVLYAISDEIHQYFVPTRYFDVLDIFCNIIGSIIGIFVYLLLLFLIKKFVIPKIHKNIKIN